MTMHMNSSGNAGLPGPHRAGGVFEEIRSVLNRPDLSDAVLLETLTEARTDQDGDLSPRDLVAGLGDAQQRAGLIRTLLVPPPAHGLDMPLHDLNPPMSIRLAPLLRRWRRLLPSARPRLKRATLIARSR